MALEMCTDGKPVAGAARRWPAGIIDRDRRRRSAGRRDRVRRGESAGAARSARTRDLPTRSPTRAAGLAACRGHARVARQDRAGAARRRSPPSTPSKRACSDGLRRRLACASASCSPTASSRPSRRRSAICSSPSARSRRFPTSRRTRRRATIKRAAVVGAGTMGGGIAMTYANAGIPVLLKEVDEAALDRGMATIRKNYEVDDVEGQDDGRAGREDDGAHHADDDLRRVRSGGHRRRSGVREHGSEEGDVRGAREGDAARLRCWRRTRRRSTSTSSRARAAGPAQVVGPPFLQPGERHEAARDRPRPRDQQGSRSRRR